MHAYLTNQQINDLTDALLSGGLNTPDARDDLLSGISLGYVATLPMRRTLMDQLRSDINQLNGVPYLVGGEVPLKIWLENAVHRLRRSFRPEQTIFQGALNEVAARSQLILQDVGEGAPLFDRPGELEQIIHQDDLLAYRWLQDALDVGNSVARLTITRYEAGQPVSHPGAAGPIQYRGTGWLIGQQYVITNHHVINARSSSEPNASESDLELQAVNAQIQFDYDSVGTEGPPVQVDSLIAWSGWNADPSLDFAILKLREASARTPLTLAPRALLEAGSRILPVNIIQHPGGNPKALGIRNNLVSSLEEWELRYFTDTMHGSSGSPVCNDNWQVIALHHATLYVDKKLNFQGKPTAWLNRGVRIDRIIDHLEENYPGEWSEIGASVI
jgi:endonuclease G